MKFIILLLLFLVPTFFYLLTIKETIELVQIKHRKLAVWQVWLGLIPLLNILWQYLIVANLMDSLYQEFNYRKTWYPLNNMKKLGGAYCLLMFLAIIPVVGIFLGLAGFICWIVFWTKVVDVKNKLKVIPLEMELGQKEDL